MFPQAIALAATWDTTLIARGSPGRSPRETRSRGIRQVLSPVVNIATDVRWGRVEETYGEDPFLASVMGARVRARVRARGHRRDAQTLRRQRRRGRARQLPDRLQRAAARGAPLPALRAAVRKAGARSMMTAYNSVDGSPATQNRGCSPTCSSATGASPDS